MSGIQRQIEKYLERYFNEHNVQRDENNFKKIITSRCSCAWGNCILKPTRYRGYCIAFLQCSPSKKGDIPLLIYDFVTETKFKKMKFS